MQQYLSASYGDCIYPPRMETIKSNYSYRVYSSALKRLYYINLSGLKWGRYLLASYGGYIYPPHIYRRLVASKGVDIYAARLETLWIRLIWRRDHREPNDRGAHGEYIHWPNRELFTPSPAPPCKETSTKLYLYIWRLRSYTFVSQKVKPKTWRPRDVKRVIWYHSLLILWWFTTDHSERPRF